MVTSVPRRLVRRVLGLGLCILAVAGLFARPISAAGGLAQPGETDLVVMIAKEKPSLYRLAGTRAAAWGATVFTAPRWILADEKRRCFFVLDWPKLRTEKAKIWRVLPSGQATVVAQISSSLDAETLGLDGRGRLLIASGALHRLEANGQLTQLFRGEPDDRPMHAILAATAGQKGGVFLTCDYSAVILPGDVPGTRTSQGGLFWADTARTPPAVRPILQNRRPGGKNYQTYWRQVRQIFLDSAGRMLLVDQGKWRTSTDSGGRKTHTRINGGIFVFHGGRLEELTYKTPTRACGPMRRPRCVAEWARDTYIVADPELYFGGPGGTGGLMLLKLDGSREARWKLGSRLKPLGVAILRGAAVAGATKTLPITLADLAGTHRAGRITRFTSVSWTKKDPTRKLIAKYNPMPPARAAAMARTLFEGATWRIGPDGSLQFAAAGANHPARKLLAIAGRVQVSGQTAMAAARYRGRSNFDSQVGSVKATIHRPARNQVVMSVQFMAFTTSERLQGEFEQTMQLTGK